MPIQIAYFLEPIPNSVPKSCKTSKFCPFLRTFVRVFDSRKNNFLLVMISLFSEDVTDSLDSLDSLDSHPIHF